MTKLIPIIAIALFIPSLSVHSAETDWLELEPGFQGKTMGARMDKVEEDPDSEEKQLTVAIPKKGLKQSPPMEEVIITGKKAEESEWTIPVTYEWATDYHNDYYGLIIKLTKDVKYPIRIYLKDEVPNSLTP